MSASSPGSPKKMERSSAMAATTNKGHITMRRTILSAFSSLAITAAIVSLPAALYAQNSPPDFSGVYYPAPQGRGAGGAAAAPAPAGQRATPAAPTRSAPTGDLSNGRAATAPS